MAELDNVIKWLDVCKTSHYAVGIKEDYPCRLCPYHEKEYCMKQLITDALELLKEQDEQKKQIMKAVWDVLHEGVSTDTVDDQDWVYEQIRNRVDKMY